MNLSTCTPGQRQSIEHVSGPLLVSAGAGSGKTFTLTQRIAYALLPESGPAASGVDEVLAITFTEKAAAEIKARVKRTLRAEGLAEEALRVDGAWISTIHGMCARILRAHALDLGLDPAFGIMGDAERADLIADAIDDPWHGGTGGLVWRGGDPRPVPLMPAVAGLTAVGTLLDEDEDAEEKRRRMEAKIAAENFGAAIGFAAGAALAVKEKLDEHAAQEKQKKQQHEQTMGGL